jgi:hypothetical protein
MAGAGVNQAAGRQLAIADTDEDQNTVSTRRTLILFHETYSLYLLLCQGFNISVGNT